jgi:hypothetical protein
MTKHEVFVQYRDCRCGDCAPTPNDPVQYAGSYLHDRVNEYANAAGRERTLTDVPKRRRKVW